jgi:N6-adenosine-specific RNA methylase IME4
MMRLVTPPAALFAPLPIVDGGFACVIADVPSRFRSNSVAKPGRNALRHYVCHSMATIATLPVHEVVSPNALLWFWTTGPLLAIGAHIPVIRAWGFEPTAMGFVWIKLNLRASTSHFTRRDLFFGGGLTTRKNAEFVVLCRRGRPERLAKDVFEIILAARREHSRKPDEAYRRIERYCAGPRLDLFPRERRVGWIPYGDETTRFDAPSVSIPSAHQRRHQDVEHSMGIKHGV